MLPYSGEFCATANYQLPITNYRMNIPPGRILIVDDETNIRSGLKAVLMKDGHEVQEASTAEKALAILSSYACEAALVDIRMPGMSGTALLREIRRQWPYLSVILLTGQGTLESAMTAVKEGARDYLLKPAQPDVIRQTMIQAIAASRRRQEQTRLFDSLRTGLQRLEELPAAPPAQHGRQRPLTVGSLQIDLQAHEVCQNGEPVPLTPSEFQLLVVLAQHAGQVIDYITLVQLALSYEAERWEAKELIKRHIFALRQKIEADPAEPHLILNVRGVGYRLATVS